MPHQYQIPDDCLLIMGIKSQMEMVLAGLLAGGVAALFTFGRESTMLALCGSIAPRVAKLNQTDSTVRSIDLDQMHGWPGACSYLIS